MAQSETRVTQARGKAHVTQIVGELLKQASWIAGPPFAYGADDAGYYAGYSAVAGEGAQEGSAVAAQRTHVVTTRFMLAEEQHAAGVTLGIAVLGLAHVLINDQPVPVELLGHWTRYDQLVYYDALPITELVHTGANTVAIELGNGFYNPAPLTLFGKYNLRERLAEVGTPQVAAVIAAGTELVAQTDATWQLARGQLVFNNLYLGEVRDLQLAVPEAACDAVTTGEAATGDASTSACGAVAADVRAAAWVSAGGGAAVAGGSAAANGVAAGTKVTVHGGPGSRTLAPAPVPPCRRLGTVAPRAMVNTPDGVFVDVGMVVAGTIDLAFRASAGQVVELIYAEAAEGAAVRVAPNVAGLVGLTTPRGACPGGPGAPMPAVQRDRLICRAGTNVYTSTFTYHSFRYVLVRGLTAADIERLSAVYVHTDVEQVGSLETHHAAYDLLFDAARRTKLNNVHDVWEDCSRERFGYGGDMVSLAHSNLMLFDEEGLLDKTLADFARDQTARGGIPETAPFMGIGSNGPAYGEGPLLWQLAFPYLAVMADRYYGRTDLIERAWPQLVRFGEYLLAFDAEELSHHCLGDHGSILTAEDGFKSGTPDKPLLGWCAQLWCFMELAEAGERAGHTADAARFAQAAAHLRHEIVERFARPDGSFGDGTQSACAFAGMLGLGDPDVQARLLAADFRARGNVLTTGIFGTMLAFDLLHRTGHDDVVEAWLLRREHPSLLAMLDTGNGVLAEQFTEHLSSLNHAMFSSYVQWLFQALGGVRVADRAVGCDTIVVRPYFSPQTPGVTCAYQTPRGVVRVAWERTAAGYVVRVAAPRCIALDVRELEAMPDVELEVTQA